MPGVNASAEAIREFKTALKGTVSELRGAAAKASAVGSEGWNDEQGKNFHTLMKKISQLIESPIDTLQAAQPKLEKLAQSLDEYSRVKF